MTRLDFSVISVLKTGPATFHVTHLRPQVPVSPSFKSLHWKRPESARRDLTVATILLLHDCGIALIGTVRSAASLVLNRLCSRTSPFASIVLPLPFVSTMARAKPTILIVTGAWHLPKVYRPLISELESAGYKVVCPELPTNNNVIPPNKLIGDDLEFIRETAQKLADEGKEIIAIGHSYGGMIITGSLYDLSTEKRENQGLSGGVKRLIYMCAFIPKKGEGLADIFGGQLPPWIEAEVSVSKSGHLFMEHHC